MRATEKAKNFFIFSFLALAFIVLIFSFLPNTQSLDKLKYIFSDPVRIEIEGLYKSEIEEIKAYRLAPSGVILKVEKIINQDPEKDISGEAPNIYYHELMISFPEGTLDRLESIDIYIGDSLFSFNKDEILQEWDRVEPDVIGKTDGDNLIVLKVPHDVRNISIINRIFTQDEQVGPIINFDIEARLIIENSSIRLASIMFLIVLVFILFIVAMKKFVIRKSFFHSSILCNITILGIFLVFSFFFILSGNSPIHDTIGWQGIFHYFSESIQDGTVPFWNPYSQTGTPFYVYYQTIGLLNPAYLIGILIQAITGCTSFTAYIISYMAIYYIFILGTYYLLKAITGNNKTSFYFSLVLFLSTAAIFFRQNGALNLVFLIPFISYFLIKFFREERYLHKGFLLSVSCYLTAAALNVYIPSGVLLYLAVFILASAILFRNYIKKQLDFFTSKTGIIWSIISILVFLSVTAPVVGIYFSSEEVSSVVRFLQKNGNNLPVLFLSDLKNNFLSGHFTGQKIVSVTLGDILGIIFEPFRFNNIAYSEITLYAGILPIFFSLVAVVKEHTRKVWLFFYLSIVVIFVMTGFNLEIVEEKSINQAVLSYVFPFLRTSEVLQNFGSIFLFTIIILASIGFEKIKKDYILRVISCTLLGVVAFKYSILIIRNNFLYGSLSLFLFFISAIIFLAFREKIYSIRDNSKPVKPINLVNIILVVIIAEMLLFNFFNSKNSIYIFPVNKEFTQLLQNEDVYEQENTKNDFMMYREVTPYEYDCNLGTVFGFEVYKHIKVAFPAVLRDKIMDSKKPYWDCFYMTKYYYDYITNIEIEKQAIPSGVSAPIIRFFPLDNVIFTDDKYSTVAEMNSCSEEQLENNIFIEEDINASNADVGVEALFDENKYLNYSYLDKYRFNKSIEKRIDTGQQFFRIIDFNENTLIVETDTLEDGYLYYSDGYSKYWKAYIDNEEVKIEKANINFKAVFIPRGTHIVKFVYMPLAYRNSLILYVLGNIIFISILLFILLANIRALMKRRRALDA